MAEASIRDLRNHGGEVVDRVAKGERVVITRSGRPVAELTPLNREPASLEVLVKKRKTLPQVDPRRFRADLDEILDALL